MEFNLSIPRLLLLVSLMAGFALLGGFTPPSLATDGLFDPHQVAKAWRYCVLLFVAGAVNASLIDHFVGTLHRSNLRLLYIIVGAILMAGSFLWLRNLQDSTHDKERRTTAGVAVSLVWPASGSPSGRTDAVQKLVV